MSREATSFTYARRLFGQKQAWIAAGVLATIAGVSIVLIGPEEAPNVGGRTLGPALYYLQWIIYAAIIVLLGSRILQYKHTLSPREDIGFVFLVTALYTIGFMLHYTPFVYHFPETALVGMLRSIVMFGCGILGAVYGLSSTHRWY